MLRTVKKIAFVFLFCLQFLSPPKTFAWATDVSAGLGPSQYLAAVSMTRSFSWPLFSSIDLRPRLGLRATHFSAGEREYQTGGSNDRAQADIEMIKIENTKHTSINMMGAIEGELKNLGVFGGFSLDLAGYTFSPKNNVDGYSADGGGVNLFRWSYNDLGTLHSETYLGKSFSNMYVRAGVTLSLTQYKIKHPQFRTERFLSFANTIFVGLGYEI